MNARIPWTLLALALAGCPATVGSVTGAPPSQDLASLEVAELPADSVYRSHFVRYVDVYGVRVLGAEGVPDAKLHHAASVLAEYIDNDEDGVADEPAVVDALSAAVAVLVMFPTADALESSGVFAASWLSSVAAQDLAADETAPPGGFDASVEEVLHLLHNAGYAQVRPELGTASDTELAAAMDLARGGYFERIPSTYPESAWYHYDDSTCDYECMAAEYFYWSLTTLMGLQAERCSDIEHEWEVCTPDGLRSVDPAVVALLQPDDFVMPSVAPDGSYRP